MVWIIRLGLTALVAAIMAVIGYEMMFKDATEPFIDRDAAIAQAFHVAHEQQRAAERWSLDGNLLLFVIPSILFWLGVGLLLRRQNYVTAVGWGFLSPLIMSFFVADAPGFFITLTMWYVAFPVGILTGVLVKMCMSMGGKKVDPMPQQS